MPVSSLRAALSRMSLSRGRANISKGLLATLPWSGALLAVPGVIVIGSPSSLRMQTTKVIRSDETSTPSVESAAPSELRVALVGLGTIGHFVGRALHEGREVPKARLAAAMVQRQRTERPNYCGEDVVLTTDADVFFASKWDVCVEVAGQPWLREHGRRVLEAGRTLLVTSVGVFTDDALHEEFVALAEKHGGRLVIAAGAMPGVDWMSSAAIEEVHEITLEQRKKPEGWKGTPAENIVDLDGVTEPVTIFEGFAREAANQFPKNANISATLALSTVGLDKLVVRLVADPGVSGPMSRVSFRGKAGKFDFEVQGTALSQRTSRIVPLSVLKALKNMSNKEVHGA